METIHNETNKVEQNNLHVDMPGLIDEIGSDIFDLISSRTNSKYKESWLIASYENDFITDEISIGLEIPNFESGANAYGTPLTFHIVVSKTTGNTRKSMMEAVAIPYYIKEHRYLKHFTVESIQHFHVQNHNSGQGIVYGFVITGIPNLGRKIEHKKEKVSTQEIQTSSSISDLLN